MNDRQRADAVYDILLARQGEQWVQPRIERTQMLLDYLDNPQRTYRVIHVTGTNGKTSTSRIIEAIIRAMGLRTGLFTSPHLERFTERIMIDGQPVADAALVDAWEEIAPFVDLVDGELTAAGDAELTFFELLTVLAFVVCADAPVDVLVLEVGMGGSWDSTNTADGDVAVFTPIGLDHAARLGRTIEEIAAVKAGIIKDGAAVVTSAQEPPVLHVLREAAHRRGASIAVEGEDFSAGDARLAVGGQQLSIRGLAGQYPEQYLPLYGAHQAFNAALAVAAVESLIGSGTQAIAPDVLAEAFATTTSPGRMQLIGTSPTVIVDAAHNPHGARALASGLREFFAFDQWGLVVGVLADKDAEGILAELHGVASQVFVTEPASDRATDADALADLVERAGAPVAVFPELQSAAEAARAWAQNGEGRAVIIAGSVVLAGEAIALADAEDWKGVRDG